jgi:hypothetical protein
MFKSTGVTQILQTNFADALPKKIPSYLLIFLIVQQKQFFLADLNLHIHTRLQSRKTLHFYFFTKEIFLA